MLSTGRAAPIERGRAEGATRRRGVRGGLQRRAERMNGDAEAKHSVIADGYSRCRNPATVAGAEVVPGRNRLPYGIDIMT